MRLRIKIYAPLAAVVFLLGIYFNPLWCAHSFASEQAPASGHGAAAGAAEGHGGGHPAPPKIYVIQWYLLVLIFVVGLWYFIKVRNGKPHEESLLPGYVLVLLVFGYYVLSYLPAIKGYHEPVKLGFLRFVFLVLGCFLVTKYGVLGRHEEHSAGHGEHAAAPDGHDAKH